MLANNSQFMIVDEANMRRFCNWSTIYIWCQGSFYLIAFILENVECKLLKVIWYFIYSTSRGKNIHLFCFNLKPLLLSWTKQYPCSPCKWALSDDSEINHLSTCKHSVYLSVNSLSLTKMDGVADAPKGSFENGTPLMVWWW